MSTSTVWCKILLLDVFPIFIFSFCSKILDKHVDGWVQRYFIRMVSWQFLAFVDCMFTKKRIWIRTSWRCLIFFNNAVSTVVYTMQVPSRNILFIHTKQFTVVFFERCRPWCVQAFLAQVSDPLFFLNFIASLKKFNMFLLEHINLLKSSSKAHVQGELSTWLRKRLWCCGMWGSHPQRSVFVLKFSCGIKPVGSRVWKNKNRACSMLESVVMWVEVKDEHHMETLFFRCQSWTPTPWELRISPTQWSCLLVAEVPECFFVLTQLQGFSKSTHKLLYLKKINTLYIMYL